MRPTHGWIAWGLGAMAVYLAAALWTPGWPVPVRVLYDGLIPIPPYRWVRPPANLRHENQTPEAGAGYVSLAASGSESGAVPTGDDQAAVIFPPGAVVPRQGESTIRVTLTPLDAAAVAPPPRGILFDGNAYLVSATYAASGAPVELRKPVTIVLRFPATGTQVLRSTGSGWTVIRSTTIPPAMQDVADSSVLGVFVAGAPARQGPSVSALLYRAFTVLLWAAALVLAVGLIRDYAVNRARRRRPRG